MGNLTIRAPDELIDALDAEADERDQSRAAYVRGILESRHECGERAAALESEVADLETELERCRNARRQLLATREEHSDLVAVVERSRSIEERWRSASMWTRWKWRVAGMPDSDE